MTTTFDTRPARTSRTTLRWAGLAVAGAAAALTIGVILDDDPASAPARSDVATPTHVVVPVAPSAAPVSAGAIDVRGMTPDAVYEWLAVDPIDLHGMTPDAAEQWVTNG